ncbi:hypothetical protein P8H26_15660 [Pseudochrobactrum sp. sp1633]|uniref:hypothetical protein n=1 Tax=Pseudochrobactrum sp. sp1633 TaxID=3036706 RepID=UPI0025A552CB|nr:hypothetical protein [Pseudochrobactrum sp. sp1633]MDM8346827.1 hypothetical protein [Pseudochrobactrum sp. sp1633]HWD14018.1 hypothetical protein [Pseudochrobactrum sp.]
MIISVLYKKTVNKPGLIIMKPNNAANADFASPHAELACRILFKTSLFSKIKGYADADYALQENAFAISL